MLVLSKRGRSDSHRKLNSSPKTGINGTAGQAAPDKGSLCHGYLQSDHKHAVRSALAQERRTLWVAISPKYTKAMGRDPNDLKALDQFCEVLNYGGA